MLFRRYSAELSPVLSYVAHQLQSGQTTEIVVLRELIWKMAGIEPLPSLSEAQIAAMAGGPVLRIEAIASETRGARLDTSESNLKGPQRLGRSLLEASLAFPLLVQVAQQRQACVFRAPDAHLKSLASLFDAVSQYSFTSDTLLTALIDARRTSAILRTPHFTTGHSTRCLCNKSVAISGRIRGEVWNLCTNMHANIPARVACGLTSKTLFLGTWNNWWIIDNYLEASFSGT
jgi:hypothetical protein